MDDLGILQFYDEYLPPTQTFIYFQLKALRRVRPVVASYQPFTNLGLFPLHGIARLPVLPRKYSPQRVWQRGARLVRGPERLKSSRWDEIALRLAPHAIRVMHAHFGPTGYLALALKQRLSVPMITTFYGRDVTAESDDWDRQELYATCDLFLAEGKFMAKQLEEGGCPAKKIHVHPIVVPLPNYPFREPRLKARPILLTAARFIEKKGLAYALDAVRILHSRGRKFEYRIIGAGPLDSHLRSFVRHHSLESCVRFLGFLPHPQYLRELQAADIFVQPSVTAIDGDTEGGAPTTLLEAQAFGLPLVSTYHADIPNVVVPGQNALLSPERDAETLASNLESLLSMPERWPSMAHIGRRFIEENHDANRQTAKLERIYFKLAKLKFSRTSHGAHKYV